MEPEFLFPAVAVCIGIVCGVLMLPAGLGLLILLVAIAPFGFWVLTGALAYPVYRALRQ